MTVRSIAHTLTTIAVICSGVYNTGCFSPAIHQTAEVLSPDEKISGLGLTFMGQMAVEEPPEGRHIEFWPMPAVEYYKRVGLTEGLDGGVRIGEWGTSLGIMFDVKKQLKVAGNIKLAASIGASMAFYKVPVIIALYPCLLASTEKTYAGVRYVFWGSPWLGSLFGRAGSFPAIFIGKRFRFIYKGKSFNLLPEASAHFAVSPERAPPFSLLE